MIAEVWDRVLDALHAVWASAGETHPAPSARTTLALGALALVLVLYAPVWRVLRHGVTILHEGGHALVAFCCGRRLRGIRLHRDTSGLTVSHGRPRGLGMILTALAGYTAPAVVGLGGAWLVHDGRAAALLWLLLVGVLCVAVQVRNWFGVLPVLCAGGAVLALAWWGPAHLQVPVATALVWFLLLGSVRPVLEMQGERRGLVRRGRRPTSDADVLAGLTWFPGGFWVAVLLVVTVGCAALGAWWLAADSLSALRG